MKAFEKEGIGGRKPSAKDFCVKKFSFPRVLFYSILHSTAGLAAGLENEGFAVRALGHGGVHFMCADHDLVERAEVFLFCMVGALLNGAGNTTIGLLCFQDSTIQIRN